MDGCGFEERGEGWGEGGCSRKRSYLVIPAQAGIQ
ncbi:hypothetical protein SAMN04487785_10422 [Dyella jiangningensis]|nr:hypothetical protein BDW41_12219 [Dyella sp. AtDHG13]SDJ81966.1 hypothetical protein SAMN04487785_10422 [Dyella jiangningensis]